MADSVLGHCKYVLPVGGYQVQADSSRALTTNIWILHTLVHIQTHGLIIHHSTAQAFLTVIIHSTANLLVATRLFRYTLPPSQQ